MHVLGNAAGTVYVTNYRIVFDTDNKVRKNTTNEMKVQFVYVYVKLISTRRGFV